MPILTCEGVIVKRSNFGEADRLLEVVTLNRGKLKVVAKGVRKITSHRGGNVELLNRVRMQLFQGQQFYTLTEIESLDTFPKIKNNLVLSTYGSYIAELASKLIPEEQQTPGAYSLIAAVLTLLEESPRQIFIRAFEVKFLSILGFWSPSQVWATVEIKSILEDLLKSSWEKIGTMKLDKSQSEELDRIIGHFLERVLESPVKSRQVMKKIKAGID